MFSVEEDGKSVGYWAVKNCKFDKVDGLFRYCTIIQDSNIIISNIKMVSIKVNCMIIVERSKSNKLRNWEFEEKINHNVMVDTIQSRICFTNKCAIGETLVWVVLKLGGINETKFVFLVWDLLKKKSFQRISD